MAVPDDTCIHMSSTGATLPVHKVIHELPQVDRAVHLPSNSVVKRLVLSPVRRLIWPIAYCIINFQDFQDSTLAKLSLELGTLPLDATVFASKLCRRCRTSSKPGKTSTESSSVALFHVQCLHNSHSIPPLLKDCMNE